jgi:hypothetical protein
MQANHSLFREFAQCEAVCSRFDERDIWASMPAELNRVLRLTISAADEFCG